MPILKIIADNETFLQQRLPYGKPVFPFVGNKSNRKEWLESLLTKLLSDTDAFQNVVFDPFGGSFYLSHIVQCVAHKLGKSVNSVINDYDDYSFLFTSQALEHMLYVKHICCERHPELKRNENLPQDDCQEIDDYIQKYCPRLDPWMPRLLTNYGASRHYRKRFTEHQTWWNGVDITHYVPNSRILSDHIDWREFLDWCLEKKLCDKDEETLWLIDPPYTTYGRAIAYGDGFKNLDISLKEILKEIYCRFPKATVLSFGYTRNFDVQGTDLHYDELNEYFPTCKGLRTRSRPEYIHIWYKADDNKRLDLKFNMEKLIDTRNPSYIEKEANWEWDDVEGHK